MDDVRFRKLAEWLVTMSEKEHDLLPKKVSDMTSDEYKIFELAAKYLGQLQFLTTEAKRLLATDGRPDAPLSMVGVEFDDIITFTYTNWRSEVSARRTTRNIFGWGSSQWHPTPQWFMCAYDMDKTEFRQFALAEMSDIMKDNGE